MPTRLSKVQKHVRKKKGGKITSLHENSRDAQRLRRAGSKDDRLAKMTSLRNKANRHWIDRVAFFQQRLPDTLHPLSMEHIQPLIDSYLRRYDEELQQLRSERRAGRPASTRQTLLEQQIHVEGSEYESGLWLPNLMDEETLVTLDNWNGDWVSLGTVRFVRIDKGGVCKDSQFPPRGAS